jgi:low temperature requirement protein LtrA
MSRLVVPPKLRTLAERGQERHASALELFFDLVFVVAAASLAALLEKAPSAEGFVRYGALFVPIWWAWVGYAFYADRFETDDLVNRLAIFSAMLAIAAVALTTPEALSGRSTIYAASYVAIRLILILLYLRAYHHEPRARPLCVRLATGYGIGAAFWFASMFVPSPARYGLWAAGMLIELATPRLYAGTVTAIPFHTSHIAERLALLTGIVLGETVALTASALNDKLHFTQSAIAATGFLVATALWWSYQDFVNEAAFKAGSSKWPSYLYGHLPIVASIPVTGAGVLLAIDSANETALAVDTRWALCGGPACFLVTTALVHRLNGKRLRSAACWSRPSAGLALSALAGFGSGLPPVVVVALVLMVLVAHITLETIGTSDSRILRATSAPLTQDVRPPAGADLHQAAPARRGE